MGSVGKRSLPKCRLRIFRGPCGGRGSGFLSRSISLTVILTLVFAPLRDAGVAVLLRQRFPGVSLSGSAAGKVVDRGDIPSWFPLIQLLFSPLYADSGDVLSAGATEPMQDTLDSGKVAGNTVASPVAGQEIEKDSASVQSEREISRKVAEKLFRDSGMLFSLMLENSENVQWCFGGFCYKIEIGFVDEDAVFFYITIIDKQNKTETQKTVKWPLEQIIRDNELKSKIISDFNSGRIGDVFWSFYSEGVVREILSLYGVNLKEAKQVITDQGVNAISTSYLPDCANKNCINGFMDAVKELRDQGYITGRQYLRLLPSFYQTIAEHNRLLSEWYYQTYVMKAMEVEVEVKAAAPISELMESDSSIVKIENGIVFLNSGISPEEAVRALIASEARRDLQNAYLIAFGDRWKERVKAQVDSLYNLAEHDKGGLLLLKKQLEELSVSDDTMNIIMDGIYETPNPDYYAWILLTSIMLSGGVFTLPHQINLDENGNIKLEIYQHLGDFEFDVVFSSPSFRDKAKEFERIFKEELQKREIYPYILVDGEKYNTLVSVMRLVGKLLDVIDENSNMDLYKLVDVELAILKNYNILKHLFFTKDVGITNPMFWTLYPEAIKEISGFVAYVKQVQRKLKESLITALKRWKAQQEQNNFSDLEHSIYQLQTTLFVEVVSGKKIPGSLFVYYSKYSQDRVFVEIKLLEDPKRRFFFDEKLPEGIRGIEKAWFVRVCIDDMSYKNLLVLKTKDGKLCLISFEFLTIE